MKQFLYPILAILTACAPHSERQNNSFGYEEKQLSEGVFALIYYVPNNWSVSDAKKKWERRAQELCGESGYKPLRYKEYKKTLGAQLAFNIGFAYEENIVASISRGIVQCPSYKGPNRISKWSDEICWTCPGLDPDYSKESKDSLFSDEFIEQQNTY